MSERAKPLFEQANVVRLKPVTERTYHYAGEDDSTSFLHEPFTVMGRKFNVHHGQYEYVLQPTGDTKETVMAFEGDIRN